MTIGEIISTFTGRVIEVTDKVHELSLVNQEQTFHFIDEIVSIEQVNGTWEEMSDSREAVFDITFRDRSNKLRVRSRFFEHLRKYKEANEFVRIYTDTEEYHNIQAKLFSKAKARTLS